MTDPRIGILNLEMGNLRSVSNAVYSLGYDPEVVDDPGALEELTHLIIPGVGAFHTAMRRMEEKGFSGPVREYAASGRPLLGLCLGMQLLASTGEEGDATRGLGLVPGHVARLRAELVPAIPHMGWNSMELAREHPVLRGVRSGVDFYFVHSYRFAADEPEHVLGTTEYGEMFPSGVARENVVGFQFHPEKSQANGLRLIENFCAWDGRC
jgi:imidazole glycerol-phosphate synthase subunit HisH